MFDFLKNQGYDSPTPESVAEMLAQLESRKQNETDRQFNLNVAKAQAGINLEVFRRHHATTSIVWAIVTVVAFAVMLLAVYIANAALIVITAIGFVAAIWLGRLHSEQAVNIRIMIERRKPEGQPDLD